jgi:hypothetical protein
MDVADHGAKIGGFTDSILEVILSISLFSAPSPYRH